MRKYSALLVSFALALFAFFALTGLHNTSFAATSCKGSGQSTCTTGQVCLESDPTVCDNANPRTPPQVLAKACARTCQKPLTAGGGDCSTTADCTGMLTCQEVNPTECQKATNPTQIIGACAKKCLQAPAKQKGESCTGSGQGNCATGLNCINNKCIQLGSAGDSCTKGTCKPGLDCVMPGHLVNPNCVHLGAGCQEQPVTGNQKGQCTAPQIANGGGNGSFTDPTPLPPPPSPPCKQWSSTGVCQTFGSTFGGFSTDPSGFIQKIFAILLSVSGGIALLLIIKAGYQLMTAQGKPEQLQNGRDQLIAAIVGLVFLIFSFVFLQLIGFDILHIPGFNGANGAANGNGTAGSVCGNGAGTCIDATICAHNPAQCNPVNGGTCNQGLTCNKN